MTFEEYEKVMAELWHISLEIYHEKKINVGDEISDIDFNLSRNYQNEGVDRYKSIIQKYKAMLSK